MSQKQFLPRKFDFSNSMIIGRSDRYHFVEEISSGSQGRVLLFRAPKSGREVVYKTYSFPSDKSSTQMIGDNQSTDRPYWSYINEIDYNIVLNITLRFAAYTKSLDEAGRFQIKDDGVYVDGEKVVPYDFISEAVDVGEDLLAQDSTLAAFPIMLDSASSVKDNLSGKRYIPITEPPGINRPLIEYYPEDYFFPLYSYEKGRTLDEVIGDVHVDSDNLVEKLMIAVLQLHYFGLVHRDLKPKNIIYTESGEIKIVDFGIAHRFYPSDRVALDAGVLEAEIRRSNLESGLSFISRKWKGSRLFSPASIYTNTSGNKDDIYSLGLLCALILTGEHPFLPEEVKDYETFRNLSDQEKKEISRAYRGKLEASLSDRIIKQDLLRRYHDFLLEHDSPTMRKIAPLFHPSDTERPNRLVSLSNDPNFRLGFPPLPPFYHLQELGGYGALGNDGEAYYKDLKEKYGVVLDFYAFEERMKSNFINLINLLT